MRRVVSRSEVEERSLEDISDMEETGKRSRQLRERNMPVQMGNVGIGLR